MSAFGPFTLDEVNNRLERDGQRIELPPKAMAVLQFLSERPGRLVTKQELLDAIWPDTFVQEGVLKSYIKEIRRALEDDAGDPRYIRTEHRRGYRFLSPQDSGEAPPTASNLAGRDSALDYLRERLGKANSGQRQVVFIAGEPGIGKTTALNAFLDEAVGSPGVRIGRGQCVEQSGVGEPYLPFFDALSRLCQQSQGSDIVAVLRRFAPTWLVQMPSLVDRTELEALQRELVGSGPLRMMREMSDAISELAKDAPLILALEDLHWSDSASIDLLGALAGRTESARLLVLATYRPVDVILSRHPLRALKQEWQAKGQCAELALELLTEAEVFGYLLGRFDLKQEVALLAARLHELTEGNPLFLVKVTDFLVDQQFITERDGAWRVARPLEELTSAVPDSLRRMIEKQFERLTADEQCTLECAAAVGVEFDVQSAAAAAGVPCLEVEETCEDLVHAQSFVRYVPATGPSAHFAFVHALYREALYEGLTRSKRKRFHLAIAQHGESLGPQGPAAAVIAHHFEQAGDWGKAVAYLEAAATQAARRYAPREALQHLDRAMELTDRDELRLEIQILKATLLRSNGQAVQAANVYEATAAQARSMGRVDQQIHSLIEASVALMWFDRPKCLASLDEAVEASRALPPDSWFQIHALGYRAFWRLVIQGWTSAEAVVFERARLAAEASGTLAVRSLYSQLAAGVALVEGDYSACERYADACFPLAAELADPHDTLTAHVVGHWARIHLGKLGDARSGYREGLRIAEKTEYGGVIVFLSIGWLWIELEAGDFQGVALACESLYPQLKSPCLHAGSLVEIAQLYAGALTGLGRLDEAGIILAEAEAVAADEEMLVEPPHEMPLRSRLSEHGLAVGDFAAARQHAERLLHLAADAPEYTYMAMGHRLLAELCLQLGDLPGAKGHSDSACEALNQLPSSIAQWRVYLTASRSAQANGDEPASREFAAKAHSAARSIAVSLEGEAHLYECFQQYPAVRSIAERLGQRPPQPLTVR